MAHRFVQTTIKDWGELYGLADGLFGFAFRGHADSSWQLTSLLERTFALYKPAVSCYDNREHWMLHEFKRKHHLYSNHRPDIQDNFEWLALMQHHGCPTRLLDFTESFYVALYFASAFSVTQSSIYAINYLALRDGLRNKANLQYNPERDLSDTMNLRHIDLVNSLIAKSQTNQNLKHLIPLESKQLSDRISRQQGIFICPTNLGEIGHPLTFMDNLAASFNTTTEAVAELEVVSPRDLMGRDYKHALYREIGLIKFNIETRVHSKILAHLNMMGLTEESLFPGLDGLARSMVQVCIRT